MSTVVHLNGKERAPRSEADDLKFAVLNLLAENVRLAQNSTAVLHSWMAVEQFIARGGDLPEEVVQSIVKLDRTRLATAMLEYLKAGRDYTVALSREMQVPRSPG